MGTAGSMLIGEMHGNGSPMHTIVISTEHPETWLQQEQPPVVKYSEDNYIKCWVICITTPGLTMQAGATTLDNACYKEDIPGRASHTNNLYM